MSELKKDPLVQKLVDSYGDWFIDSPEDARAMTGKLYPFETDRKSVV